MLTIPMVHVCIYIYIHTCYGLHIPCGVRGGADRPELQHSPKMTRPAVKEAGSNEADDGVICIGVCALS